MLTDNTWSHHTPVPWHLAAGLLGVKYTMSKFLKLCPLSTKWSTEVQYPRACLQGITVSYHTSHDWIICITDKDWHMTSSQGSEQCNTARLLPTYHTVYTITIHDVTSWHTDRTPTTVLVTSYNWEYINQQFNNLTWHSHNRLWKSLHLLLTDSWRSCSRLISNYFTCWYRKSKNATGM